MSKIINVENTDEFFEKVKNSKEFKCDDAQSRLKLRYNEVFTSLGNPKITLTMLNDKEIKYTISPNIPMIVLAVITALFFWGIMIFAVVNNKNTAAIVIAALAPTVMWLIELGFLKGISKIILNELNKINKKEK